MLRAEQQQFMENIYEGSANLFEQTDEFFIPKEDINGVLHMLNRVPLTPGASFWSL